MTAYGDDRLPPRIWEKIVVEPSGCWKWIGAKNGSGYGLGYFAGKMRLAHRWTYHVFVSSLDWDVPRGYAREHVHHLCKVPACVNPVHLEAKPAAEHLGHGHRDKTHCPHGHPYDESNTHRSSRGWRTCRTCDRDRVRRRRAAL